MIDLSVLTRHAVGGELEEVRMTRRYLRAIANEIAEGRMALARLAQRSAVDQVLLDISSPPPQRNK